MTAIVRNRLDKASFFDWLQGQDRRYELVDGLPVMLPWVTRNHDLITTNIILALGTRLDRARLAIHTGDFAVETGDEGVRFPDVMVEPAGGDGHSRSTENAILLIEILSKSSVEVDFKEKLIEYTRLAACDTYLICNQDEPVVWQWTRRDGRWPDAPMRIEGLERVIELGVFDCRLPLHEVYFGVVRSSGSIT